MPTLKDADSAVQVIVVDAFDIDLLNQILKKTDTEYQLLSGGHFHGQANRIELEQCTIEGGYANQWLLVRGKFPADKVTLGYILSSREAGYLNSQRVTQHNLIIFPEGYEFEHIEPPFMRWALLQISRNTLIEMGFPLSLDHFTILSGLSTEGVTLQNLLIGLFDRGPDTPGFIHDKKMLEDEVVSRFILAANSLSIKHDSIQHMQKREQLNLLQKIDEYIGSNCTRRIRIEELVTLTGIQQRSLEYLFKECLNMSPHRYMTITRLNRAYSDLRLGSPDNTSVSQIMNRYGFNHPGRFSQEYNKLFGETPSTTLRNQHAGIRILS